jgi:prevent-host-death family protein
MQVSVSELKANAGKYVELAAEQDIFITKNGKQVAKLVSTKIDKVALMKSVFGSIPAEAADIDKAREERFR